MSKPLELKVVFAAIDKFIRPVKAITDGARAASRELRATKDALKGLNDQQRLIDSFRGTNKALGIDARKLEEARDRVRKLAEAMAATDAPTVKLQRAFSAARDEAAQLSANVNRLTERKQRLRHELAAAGVDTRQLATHQRDLKGKIDAATAAVSRQSAALEAQNQKMMRLHAARADLDKSLALRNTLAGAGAGITAAGTGISAAGAAPVMAYARAEDSATQLKIALQKSSGEVGAEFAEINALAEKLGNKLPGATSDYQDMMTMLIRQGMPAKALLGGLGEATAYLSVQLKMGPAAAAEFASKLQDATRTVDKDMMGLMDTIQKTFYLGVDQNNMLQGFSKLSPALSILKREGLGAANALAPLLVLTDQAGMAGESAGNAFRKIFQMSLDKKRLEKGNDELDGTGIKLDFSDGKGEFGGLEKMYAELEKLRGVNTQQRLAALKKIFGDDAETLQALTIMIEKGVGGYREVQAKMAAQADIQQRVNLQLNTLKSLWDAATGTFTNVLVAFGESIAPELHATAEWLGKVTERTQAWARENPHLAAGIMTTVKWLAVGLTVIGGLTLAMAAVLGPLAMLRYAFVTLGISGVGASSAFGLIMGGIGKLGSALLWIGGLAMAHPLIAMITVVAAGAAYVWANWEQLGPRFSALLDRVGGYLGGLKDRAIETGRQMIDGMIDGINARWEALKSAVSGIGDASIGWLKDKLGIHSPSRVFAELGGYTMEGFAQGMQGGEDGPLQALGAMSRKLAAIGAGIAIGGGSMAGEIALDTRPPIGPASNAAGGNTTYQIVIHAAPGTDNQGLAALVAREIERIEARRSAQARSRLRDVE